MSYDVRFAPSDGRVAPAINELDAWFSARSGYKVEPGSAHYTREHTGTAFRFVYDDEQRGYADEGPIRLVAITEAPATRALELVDEVEALVRAFDLVVDDPTMHGMGKGALDREALVRGCQFASRFGYVVEIAMQRISADTVLLYDDAKLEAIWRWNHAHDRLEAETSENVFVPHITMLARGREVMSSVAWLGDGAILLPEVDAISTIDTSGGGAELKLVHASVLDPFIVWLEVRGDPAPHRLVEASQEITDAIQAAEAITPAPARVAPNAVLGKAFWAQTVDEHRVWSGGKTLVIDDGEGDEERPAKKAAAKKKAKPVAKKKAKPVAKKKAKPAAKKKAKPAAKKKAKPVAKKKKKAKPVAKKKKKAKPVAKKKKKAKPVAKKKKKAKGKRG